MSKRESPQWDYVKFLTTLGYFGEVPFIGNFRWLQKWLGYDLAVAGKSLESIPTKAMLMGNYPEASLDLLQKHISPTVIALSSHQPSQRLEKDSLAVTQDHLYKALVATDTVVIWDHPSLSSLVTGLSMHLGEAADIIRQTAFDFTSADSNLSVWGALDDVVMGGVSEGTFFLRAQRPSTPGQSKSAAAHSAVFAGRVSTENSGGFSSVRSRNFEPPFNFLGWTGLWLRVKGDGQRYKFIVRNSQAWDSPAYVYIFNTVEDEWIDVSIPFAGLIPTFRAKSVPNASPFDPSQTFSFQLMLSKFEYDGRLNPQFLAGPFELAVAKIEAYRKRQGRPLIVVGAWETAAREQQQSALAQSGLRYQFIEPENQDVVEAIAATLAQEAE